MQAKCYTFFMKNQKIANFEKISLSQFKNDYTKLFNSSVDANLIANVYNNICLPKRATNGSAGYDFYSTVSIELKPSETIKIPTGIRAQMNEDYVLGIFPRSSLGMKFQMCLTNTVGIVDSDYYHADNEGHIIISIVNRGEKTLVINEGDRFVQGIFFQYGVAEEEEVTEKRTGGFGSSGK